MVALVAGSMWPYDLDASETNLLKLGLLLPPEEPQARSVREGVLLAKERSSQAIGCRLDVVIRGRVGQWGADAVEVARMVTDDGVGGLIAPPDGAASHLTLQVSGRTAVPVVTLCADSSVGRTGVPWLLRVVPRTTDEAGALFAGITPGVPAQTNRWLAVVPDGRVGRELSRDLRQAAAGCAVSLEKVIELNPSLTSARLVCSQVMSSRAQFVLLWLDPLSAGKMVRDLRTAGYRGILAGPARLQSADFIAACSGALGGFIIPGIPLTSEEARRWLSFHASYQARWGHEPDTTAAMSYDAAMLLSYLLRQPEFQAPPHRLAPGFSWPGVLGTLNFDAEGNRSVKLELLQAHDHSFSRFLKAD